MINGRFDRRHYVFGRVYYRSGLRMPSKNTITVIWDELFFCVVASPKGKTKRASLFRRSFVSFYRKPNPERPSKYSGGPTSKTRKITRMNRHGRLLLPSSCFFLLPGATIVAARSRTIRSALGIFSRFFASFLGDSFLRAYISHSERKNE
jgi:hypothetical protein